MAIRGLSFNEEETYICRDDPCLIRQVDGSVDVRASLDNGATGFVLVNVPSGVMSDIQDMGQVIETQQFSQVNTYRTQTNKKSRKAFKWGAKEFINFPDSNDQPIKAEREQVMEGGRVFLNLTEETLDRVPTSILTEVGQEIVRRNSMTDEQAKNSEALLSQLGGSRTSSVTSATDTNNSAEDTTDDTKNQTSKETPNSQD